MGADMGGTEILNAIEDCLKNDNLTSKKKII
jgi:hypothetical protein